MTRTGMNSKEIIAARAAKELKDGDVVNLGIGLPSLAANFMPPGVSLILHAENGMLGMGPAPEPGAENPDVVNAGGRPATAQTGGVFLDICASFGIMRSGRIDAAVLGALEVDELGNLANWIVPGGMVSGMGGAMDLAVGAKKVISAMLHTQNGRPKIRRRCTLPLTAAGVVKTIITEMGVMEVTSAGLVLTEIHPDYRVEQVREATEARLIISPDLKPME
jgi:acetate CoA/acetoacetate CoA-transferase beta subunit